MNWEIPATTATELAAAFLQAAITLGLAGLFAYLYQQYRKPYFGWFALAWLLFVVRIGAIITFLATQGWVWLYWHQVITGWTALVLLWAALVFSRQPPWRPTYLLLVLFPPLWSFVAIYQMDNFLLAAGPAVAFLSIATLWTGWAFFRYYRIVGSTAAGVLTVTLVLWGLHHLDYPFLRARGAWNPWGYYLDILFVLGVGASTLLLVLEDLGRGLGALSALSGELQRHRSKPNEDVFAPLLARTITLTGVRGSAIYLGAEEGGSFVAAVGVCESWEGSQPTGPAAEAIGRVLETGGPEAVGNWRHTRSDGTEHPYAAALPILQGQRISGALVIVGDARDPFAALDEQFLRALGQQVGAALEHVELYRRLEQRREELERLTQAMVNQHEDERRRLSRELHDETAQVFSAVKLELGVARETSSPELAPRLDRAMGLIDTGMRSIRNVTSRLRPSLIDDVGLLPALRALTHDFRGRDLMLVEFDAPDALPPLSEHVELALFRGLQEGLANVVRHARAQAVVVSIEVQNREVVMRIRDDGQGLPVDWSIERVEGRGHMGIAGMRERVNALGGEFSVSSSPNGGVDLSLTLPTLPVGT